MKKCVECETVYFRLNWSLQQQEFPPIVASDWLRSWHSSRNLSDSSHWFSVVSKKCRPGVLKSIIKPLRFLPSTWFGRYTFLIILMYLSILVHDCENKWVICNQRLRVDIRRDRSSVQLSIWRPLPLRNLPWLRWLNKIGNQITFESILDEFHQSY